MTHSTPAYPSERILELERACDLAGLIELALELSPPYYFGRSFVSWLLAARAETPRPRLIAAGDVLWGLTRDGRRLERPHDPVLYRPALEAAHERLTDEIRAIYNTEMLAPAVEADPAAVSKTRRALTVVGWLIESRLFSLGELALRELSPNLADLAWLNRRVTHLIYEADWVDIGAGAWTALGAIRGDELTLRRGSYAVTLVWA